MARLQDPETGIIYDTETGQAVNLTGPQTPTTSQTPRFDAAVPPTPGEGSSAPGSGVPPVTGGSPTTRPSTKSLVEGEVLEPRFLRQYRGTDGFLHKVYEVYSLNAMGQLEIDEEDRIDKSDYYEAADVAYQRQQKTAAAKEKDPFERQVRVETPATQTESARAYYNYYDREGKLTRSEVAPQWDQPKQPKVPEPAKYPLQPGQKPTDTNPNTGEIAGWDDTTGDYTRHVGWDPDVIKTNTDKANADYIARLKATSGANQQSNNIFDQISALQRQQAEMAKTPASWLQAGNQVVQPWMMGMLGQNPELKVGQPIPGITGGNYSTANAQSKTWDPTKGEIDVATGNPRGDWVLGDVTPYATYNPYNFKDMPVLTPPSAQYFARMPYEGQQGYYGYQQAKTGQTPEGVAKSMWDTAPPSGKNKPLSWLR